MTALLVAIDVGSLSMIQFLVQNGASVNQESNMGSLRAPLQRTAEIGDFQLVKYFLEQRTVVDTAPVYGGGTALQLAAISSYVGIAALLIERGANVDYPPAKGPGRTAFEAAAEWRRPDMMRFLVQHGVQLDLELVEEVEEEIETDDPGDVSLGIDVQLHTVRIICTRYERAIQFARDRGEHASKRIVQRLGREFWSDGSNGFPSIQGQVRSSLPIDCNCDRCTGGSNSLAKSLAVYLIDTE
ncbi:uncharacterized protein EKO05_0005126 [Ascochyta rabiei]|uniref:uncharacterized protein n=1 Tax=Didymella rabiei TaxID=5454 RepID=UPI002203FCAB|nr:uncharacterized protein EKO05_0005126 [Ascochyta rabiei]UPX14649.1 hypothetical protein EKO05_0005126 [Ascochyta rabiei]